MRSLSRTVLARALRLPAPTHTARVERDLAMTTSDGVTLLADRHHPDRNDPAPVVLMRSPYGRGGLGGLEATLLAERGCQVVVQSCRGTFGSGGDFDPLRDERQDGAETVDWLRTQPWCDGRIMTFGGSYVGMTQWAAVDGGADVDAMAVHVADTHPPTSMTWLGGAFALETNAMWIRGLYVDGPRPRRDLVREAFTTGEFRETVASTRALRETDRRVRDLTMPFFQAWLDHPDTTDAWWDQIDFRGAVDDAPASVTSLAGWYDIFLPGQLRDVVALQERGVRPRLRVGPWTHFLGPRFKVVDALRQYDEVFADGVLPYGIHDEAPIQLQLCRSKEWLGFDAWPPPSTSRTLHLRAGGGLHESPATADERPTGWTYDPEDPTPSVGGTHLSSKAGAKDQRLREGRDDVAVFTSLPVDRPTRIVGDLEVELYVETSLAHADLFVRLCHVDTKGVSTNIADGIVRMTPENGLGVADQVRKVTVPMAPCGLSVQPGERLRLQVSNGAHPAIARNWGVDDPGVTASSGRPCVVRLHHDAAHPSRLVVPVLEDEH